MALLTLNRKGVITAVLLGAALLFLGGKYGPLMLSLMLYFLFASFLVTRIRLDYKEKHRLTERSRGAINVIANGLGPLVFASLVFIGGIYANNLLETMGLVGFAASVAGITSDKFASELGVLDGTPREILTLRRSKKGRSGAVTAFGLCMAFAGAASVAVLFYLWQYITAVPIPWIIMTITLFGFAGSIADSVAGYFEERGFGNKHTSNLVCALVAGLIAALVVLI